MTLRREVELTGLQGAAAPQQGRWPWGWGLVTSSLGRKVIWVDPPPRSSMPTLPEPMASLGRKGAQLPGQPEVGGQGLGQVAS